MVVLSAGRTNRTGESSSQPPVGERFSSGMRELAGTRAQYRRAHTIPLTGVMLRRSKFFGSAMNDRLELWARLQNGVALFGEVVRRRLQEFQVRKLRDDGGVFIVDDADV